MKFGERFFGKSQEKKIEKILPESVRYALAHNEAKVGRDTIEILNNNHFTPEASYLLTKLLETNEDMRFKYISALVEAYSQSNQENLRAQKITEEFLKDISNEREVDAMKLAQLSRQGFEFWQEQYQQKAKELSQKDEDTFLLANSTIIGLKPIVQEFYNKKKSFGIIFPKNILDDSTILGYEYIFENTAYKPILIGRNTDNFTKCVLLDDVENTGETRKLIEENWAKAFGGEVEYTTIAKTQ